MNDRPSSSNNSSSPADVSLVRRASMRDPAAGRELSERLKCVPRMLTVINRRRGSPLGDDDLRDVVQDTLLLILGKLDAFHGATSLERWALAFCINEYANARRRHLKRQSHLTNRTSVQEPVSEPSEPEDFEYLHLAIAELESPVSDVIRMKALHGMTFDQVADVMSTSPNTVKSWFYRGLERLREQLTPRLRKEAL